MSSAIASVVYQIAYDRARRGRVAPRLIGHDPIYPDPETLARELGHPDEPEIVAAARQAVEDAAAERPSRYEPVAHEAVPVDPTTAGWVLTRS